MHKYNCRQCTKVVDVGQWTVEGILSEGLTLFCGPPKKGKSWAMLQLGMSVSRGSWLFSHYPCEEGNVLYLYLEDGERVAIDRVKKTLGNAPVPKNLSFAFSWERGDQAIQELEDMLSERPDISLVIVDCFAEICGDNSTFAVAGVIK